MVDIKPGHYYMCSTESTDVFLGAVIHMDVYFINTRTGFPWCPNNLESPIKDVSSLYSVQRHLDI